jgi:wobble nucleotide-excising tRNase
LRTLAASILQAALPGVLRVARESLSAHIARGFKDPTGAEPWIQEGLRQNRGEICQLCGQTLSDDALGLFQAYENYFSVEYAHRETEVRTELPRLVASIEEAGMARCLPRVEQNDLILAQYSDCEAASEFREAVTRARETGQALAKAESRYQRSVNDFHGALKSSAQEKIQSPMTTVASPLADELDASESALRDAVLAYYSAISVVNDVIRALKAASTTGRIEEEGKKLVAEKEAKGRLLRRLELAPQVEKYQSESKLVGKLDSEINALGKRLGEEQSAFLASYFERLNEYFQRFGSREFELRRHVDYRGHLPVVSIEVLFRSSSVPNARVEHLFSASDRRALSLAVFWAQVYGLAESERAKTILVLDDPVTSFDEHRIAAHNDAVLKASRDFRQVVVLTHFRDQVARFLRAYAGEGPRILALQRDGEATKIVAGDVEALTATDHEQARKRLFDFADARSTSVDGGSMRVFFETELEHRFAHQLNRHAISGGTLTERIDKMADVGILSPMIAREAHDWRLRLNPDHHGWVGATIEDQRSTANELRDFIYLRLSAGGGV